MMANGRRLVYRSSKSVILALLYQLSYQAHWELVVMWVDDEPAFIGIDLCVYDVDTWKSCIWTADWDEDWSVWSSQFFFLNERDLKNFLIKVKKTNKNTKKRARIRHFKLRLNFQFKYMTFKYQHHIYRLVSSPSRPTSFLPPVKRAERNRALWLNDFATFCKRKYEMTESSAWLIYTS